MNISDFQAENQEPTPTGPTVGAGVAVGVAFGVLLFALTQSVVWIALGAGFGVLLGAVLQARSA